jgi:tRNA pseudouridine55 synthase
VNGTFILNSMSLNFTPDMIIEGLIFPFNKPYGWTSFDLVNKVRQLLTKNTGIKKIKVGHAGTLDPLATGLLILCSGNATKKIEKFQALPKTYEAELTLGATTPSYDLETEINKTYPTEHINRDILHDKLEQLKGKIMQLPPMFSAKKFNGKRAYEYARNGINKKMNPVEIEIFNIEIIRYNSPILELKLTCSKGTYIRSFAHDLGLLLNSGAYLSALTRSAIGNFSLLDAWDIEKFEKNLNIL